MKFNLLYLLSIVGAITSTQIKGIDDDQDTKSLNIVLHSAMGGRSHIKGVLEIGDELSKRGHKLTYVTYEENIRFTEGYNISNYSIGKLFLDDKLTSKAITKRIMSKFKEHPLKMMANTLGKMLINNYEISYEPLKQYLMDNKPDLLVCDFFAHPCLDLAKQLAIPLIIGLQTTDIPGVTDEPFITNGFEYIPITTKDMKFWDKFYYKILNPMLGLPYLFQMLNQENEIRKKFNVPSTNSLIGDLNYGMGIANTFIGFEAAIKLMPNVYQVGPIVSENKDQLSSDLKQFLNNNKRTLFVAFGSNFVLNEELSKKILEGALLAINKNIIDAVVWGLGRTTIDDFPTEIDDGKGGIIKVTDLFNNIHSSIRLLNWAPQVSILNHSNTKVFISHGGIESTFEAVYSGTPVLCLALFGDQTRNAKKIEDMGTGLYINKFEFTANSLSSQIQVLLEDKDNKFSSNLKRMKTIAKFSSRKIIQAADLFEQHAYTAKACRPFEPYNINSNLPPCEIKHLIPISSQMPFIAANGIDIYGMAIILFFIGVITLSFLFYKVAMVLLSYFITKDTKSKRE